MQSCYFKEYNPNRNFKKFQKGVFTHDSLEKVLKVKTFPKVPSCKIILYETSFEKIVSRRQGQMSLATVSFTIQQAIIHFSILIQIGYKIHT